MAAAWWQRLFGRDSGSNLRGQKYRTDCALYSLDGKRGAEVLAFASGEVYLRETEWVEGTEFRHRNAGRLIGPFSSPEEAEHFIIATPWFKGEQA